MWSKIFATILCLCCFSATFAQQQKVKPIIFDSDMGPDYDDVGAITLLHAFADSGYIRILATVASTNYEGVAGVLNVFNTYFHRAGLPVGVPKQNGLLLRDDQHWTDTLLARYPHTIRQNADAPDAVEVYRKVLATQPDHSVTIVSIGFFTNLAHLLQSKPDANSPLTGAQLVQQKVKQLVSMAGKFPAGKEFNVAMDAGTAAFVFTHWPTNIIFSGFEIGEKIKAGLPLTHANDIQHSPVKDVFSMCIPMSKEDSVGRMSWDETAVLVACKGIAPYYKLHSGSIVMHADGSNGWSNVGKRQGYLAERVSAIVVQDYINKVIMHQPVEK